MFDIKGSELGSPATQGRQALGGSDDVLQQILQTLLTLLLQQSKGGGDSVAAQLKRKKPKAAKKNTKKPEVKVSVGQEGLKTATSTSQPQGPRPRAAAPQRENSKNNSALPKRSGPGIGTPSPPLGHLDPRDWHGTVIDYAIFA